MKYTLTFSEKAKGWTSFHSFFPEWMVKVNNRFYTFLNGQLYLHNDRSNPIMNQYYGDGVTSKIETVVNNENSEDKIFKTLVLEGNAPWKTSVKTNLMSGSTIEFGEYNQRESRFFAYVRSNEDDTDLRGGNANGIGVVVSVSGNNITYGALPSMISVSDRLYQINGSAQEFLGTITSISGNVITVDSLSRTPVPGYFSFAMKNSRVEGSTIRGTHLEITLETDSSDPVSLLAIESNIVKSYV